VRSTFTASADFGLQPDCHLGARSLGLSGHMVSCRSLVTQVQPNSSVLKGVQHLRGQAAVGLGVCWGCGGRQKGMWPTGCTKSPWIPSNWN